MRAIAFNLIMVFSFLTVCSAGTAQTSVCGLAKHPEKFMDKQVEVVGMAKIGFEQAFIHADGCLFKFTRGDDYQKFGKRFRVKKNKDWYLFLEALDHPLCENVDVEAVNARFTGTVIFVPSFPANGMGMELVIQSVSHVEQVRMKCVQS